MSANENVEELIRSGPAADEINNLFSSIAGTYDLANDLITFGIARRWRRELVRWSQDGLPPVARVLDCATGTGDLAFEFARTLADSPEPLEIVGSDFCKPMLEIAKKKSAEVLAQLNSKKTNSVCMNFEWADATALPYENDHFDVCSIAYGIRNVKDVTQALKEMARVTRPDGHVMILETGVVENRLLRLFVQLHFQIMVPFLGGLVSGRRAAYQYLQKSSNTFPAGKDFCEVLQATGCFSSVEYRALMGGASYIYRARVQ